MARNSVRYTPDHKGMRDFGREAFIGEAAVEAGRAVAAWARNNDPKGDYGAQEVGVTAGRNNEMRAGAVVTETVQGEGRWKRTLARAAQEARS